jgi:cytochrome c oxidase cbb3-type subunit 3
MTEDMRQDHLLSHNYDGIQEYDNPLPRWWVWIFWVTIIFSVAYMFDFTGRIRGPGRMAQYERQIAAARERFPEPAGAPDESTLVTMSRDAALIAAGKTAFNTYCAACHRPDGGGLIGPNLTDEYWIHGGKISDIHRTITDGAVEKGMPPWGKVFRPQQISELTVFVNSLKGTNPPDPKPPQGEKVPPG